MSDLLLPPEHRYAKIIEQSKNEDGSEFSILNLGPSHPATHGIFQNILLMDGERVVDSEPTLGYIPVSYTHLDVYKRQMYICATFRNN